MSEKIHPLAAHHIPSFLPGPDGSDPLMTIMIVVLIALVIIGGSFYLNLHSLPERVVHGNERMQMEIVAILALLALFTHNNFFWIAALLLAFIQLPDFVTPLESIATSLARLSGRKDTEAVPDNSPLDAGEPSLENMSTTAGVNPAPPTRTEGPLAEKE